MMGQIREELERLEEVDDEIARHKRNVAYAQSRRREMESDLVETLAKQGVYNCLRVDAKRLRSVLGDSPR